MKFRVGILLLFLAALCLGNTNAPLSVHTTPGLYEQLRSSAQLSPLDLKPSTETCLATEEEDIPENSILKKLSGAPAGKIPAYFLTASHPDRRLSRSNTSTPPGAYDSKQYLVFRVFLI